MMAGEGWRTWNLNDPEPAGAAIVRDSSGVVSYSDSPQWQVVVGAVGAPRRWRGFKNGERVELDWVELLLLWGPVTGKVRAVSEVAA